MIKLALDHVEDEIEQDFVIKAEFYTENQQLEERISQI